MLQRTVSAEAQLPSHVHCAAPVYVLIVCVLAHYTVQVCDVYQLRDLVLFVYSVQHGCKVSLAAGLCTLYTQQVHCVTRVPPTFPARARF